MILTLSPEKREDGTVCIYGINPEPIIAADLRELHAVLTKHYTDLGEDVTVVFLPKVELTTVTVRYFHNGTFKLVLGNCAHYCTKTFQDLANKIEDYLVFGESLSGEDGQ
jgi:hypothetical protein